MGEINNNGESLVAGITAQAAASAAFAGERSAITNSVVVSPPAAVETVAPVEAVEPPAPESTEGETAEPVEAAQ